MRICSLICSKILTKNQVVIFRASKQHSVTNSYCDFTPETSKMLEIWTCEKSWTRWWQLKYFLFSPLPPWGNDPIWRAYFSNGLVQPPTSENSSTVPTKTQLSNFLGTPGEDYFKGNPKSLNFYFLVIWWGKSTIFAFFRMVETWSFVPWVVGSSLGPDHAATTCCLVGFTSRECTVSW